MRVPERFSGPIGFANGGWFAGMAAQASEFDPAEITLRRPIPLEVDLRVDDNTVRQGEDLVAEMSRGDFTRDVPGFVDRDTALDAETRTLVRSSPKYGHCLVCGVDREDGYRLRPGAVARVEDTVACLWRPSSLTPLLDSADVIPATWAALDCPGVWTTDAPSDPMLLGRMTASVVTPPDLNEEFISVGRWHAREGRKMLTSTALYSTDGQLIGHAEQVWIAITGHPVR